MKKENRFPEKYLPAILIAVLSGVLIGVLESATIMHLNPLAQSAVEKLFFFLLTIIVYAALLAVVSVLVFKIFSLAGLNSLNWSVLSGIIPAALLMACAAYSLQAFKSDRAAAPAEGRGSGPEAMNLLMISIDTLRADHLGCYGNDSVLTPCLDRLAEKGALFSQAFCQIPGTNPSHATAMTGLYPPVHGSRFNGIPIRPETVTLAETLKKAGYATGAFISCSAMDKEISGLQKGFDTYNQDLFPSHLNQQIYHLFPMKIARRLGLFSSAERKGERVNESAIPWLRSRGSAPFFLWVHYFDPHVLYDPPPPYDVMYTGGLDSDLNFDIALLKNIGESKINLSREDVAYYRGKYCGEISYTDYCISVLLDELEKAGLAENTAVILFADHGESLGEHNYYFFHGKYLYEPSLRVPLLISWPGMPARGITIDRMVRLIDIAPTVLSLLGIPAPPGMQGRDLTPLIEGRELPQAPAYGENSARFYYQAGQAFIPVYEDKLYSIRTENWKYIEKEGGRFRELYDLKADYEEQRNLAPRHPEIVASLSRELAKYVDMGKTDPLAEQEEASFDRDLLKKLEILGYIETRK
jgi:arylsulfatase A-like enzyme